MERNIHRVVASVSNCLFRITATGRLIVVSAWCSRWWTFQGYKYYTEVNNGKFFLPRIGHSNGIAERSQETLGNALEGEGKRGSYPKSTTWTSSSPPHVYLLPKSTCSGHWKLRQYTESPSSSQPSTPFAGGASARHGIQESRTRRASHVRHQHHRFAMKGI